MKVFRDTGNGTWAWKALNAWLTDPFRSNAAPLPEDLSDYLRECASVILDPSLDKKELLARMRLAGNQRGGRGRHLQTMLERKQLDALARLEGQLQLMKSDNDAFRSVAAKTKEEATERVAEATGRTPRALKQLEARWKKKRLTR